MTPEEQPRSQSPAKSGKDASTELSILRSYLSNERTHLSYLRTAISFVGFGITLNRFSIYLQEKKGVTEQTGRLGLRSTENVGAGMVILGLLLLAWSVYRFWTVSRAIQSLHYDPRHRMLLVMTLAMLLAGGVSAVWLFLLAGGH